MKKKIMIIGLIIVLFAVVLGVGFGLGQKREEEKSQFSFKYMETPFRDYQTRFSLIGSSQELEKYYEDCFVENGFHNTTYASDFRENMKTYDENYFEHRMLVLVWLGMSDDSTRNEVTDVFFNKKKELEIHITAISSETCMDSDEGWHIWVEFENEIPVTENNIKVIQVENVVDNPQFTICFPNRAEYSVEGSFALDVRNDMYLKALDYQKNDICECDAEYTITFKSQIQQEQYEINLSEGCIRCEKGHAHLDKDDAKYESIQYWISLLRYEMKLEGIEPDTEHLGFLVKYIFTGSDANYVPKAFVIRSVEELQQYYEENISLGEDEPGTYEQRFLNASERYNEEYFKNQVLILVKKGESSGSIRHDVTNVFKNEEGELEIAIETLFMGFGTADVAGWHFFIEPSKEMNLTGDEKIKIVLDGEVVENPVFTMDFLNGIQYSIEGQAAFWMRSAMFEKLKYKENDTCTSDPEYIVTIESDVRHEVYEINLSEGCVRFGNGHAKLDENQMEGLEHEIQYFIGYYMVEDGLGYDIDFSFVQMDLASGQRVFVFHSVEELNAYYEEMVGEGKVISESFAVQYQSICEKYDEEYFENQILILVWLMEPSSPSSHEVTQVFFNSERKLGIRISTTLLGNDAAVTGEHLFISPAEGIYVEDTSDIEIVWDGEVVSFED